MIVAGVVVAALIAGGFVYFRRQSGPTATTAPTDETTMAVVPAGTYVIGNGTSGNAAPRHTEPLPAFRIDKHEVTIGEYNEFVTAMHVAAPWGAVMPVTNLPVTRVGWNDAGRYCAWRHPDGGRLPSEAEWEAAARGTQGLVYPWGNEAKAGAANIASAGMSAPAPVGSFIGGNTPSGISDLIGNVWEWTSSPMAPYPNGAAMSGLGAYRVIRGGAFNTADAIATAWYRGYNSPDAAPAALEFTGFRCAK